jgi:quinol monooxygenase YgiN
VAFIQTISFSSSRMDELQKVMQEWDEQQTEPAPGFVGTRVLKDRDTEGRFMVIAEFENYDMAMQNSARPETDAFAKRMAELCDGPPSFGNYDLIREDRP